MSDPLQVLQQRALKCTRECAAKVKKKLSYEIKKRKR